MYICMSYYNYYFDCQYSWVKLHMYVAIFCTKLHVVAIYRHVVAIYRQVVAIYRHVAYTD